MFDPISMMTMVSIGASAAGAGLDFLGSKKSAKAKREMYQYQAAIAKRNEEIQKANAEYALRAGEREVVQSGMKSAALMGKIRANQGASGVDVNSGSNLAVQESAHKVGLMDQAQLRENAGQRVKAYWNAAESERLQGGLYGMAAANADVEGDIAGAKSIIGGVSSVSSKWLQAKQFGVPAASKSFEWGI